MVKQILETVQLRYLDYTIKVSLPRESDAQWLKEFFCPVFSIVESPTSDVQIELILDDERYNNMLARKPARDDFVDGFILDTKIVRFILWQSCADSDVYFDQEFHVFYVVSRQAQKTLVLAHSTHSIAYRTALMRVIREYAIAAAGKQNGFFLHGAAFESGGKGMIIAGHKNSGKTSLLLHCLQRPGVRYITNDRVFVNFKNDSIDLSGMPTIITILKDSLAMFPHLKAQMCHYNFHQRYTVQEILSRGCVPYSLEKGEFTLTPMQLRRIVGRESIGRSVLKAILFPKITRRPGGIEIRRLSPEEAIEYLREAQLGKSLPSAWSVFDSGNNNEVFTADEKFKQGIVPCANQVACFECLLGLQAFKDKTLLEKLESRLEDYTGILS